MIGRRLRMLRDDINAVWLLIHKCASGHIISIDATSRIHGNYADLAPKSLHVFAHNVDNFTVIRSGEQCLTMSYNSNRPFSASAPRRLSSCRILVLGGGEIAQLVRARGR